MTSTDGATKTSDDTGKLPDAVIIGAAKSATTSLFQRLISHPEISHGPTDDINGEMIPRLLGVLQEALGDRDVAALEHLPGPNRLVDETAKFWVRDRRGVLFAFVLVSPAADPAIVARGMLLAAECKSRLGPDAGRVIFKPLLEGHLDVLSYAVLPYWQPMRFGRLRGRLDQWVLRGGLCDWVAKVAELSAEVVPQDRLQESFERPLAFVADTESFDPQIRQAARVSMKRLDKGDWRPSYVVMHGDLWQGNVLFAPATVEGQWLPRRDRFFIIDWPGSALRGYPMFDLVRLLMALRLDDKARSAQVARHCQILRCEPVDAVSYLLAALGSIGLNRGHFPLGDYVEMSSSSYRIIRRSLDLRS